MTADLRYPIGPFVHVADSPDLHSAALADIAELPARLRSAVLDLTEPQLKTPYRPGGWTVWQVVHHVADSHMNGLIRTKLALTEERPTIKPYDENAWATLPDMELPLELSLGIIDGVHARWAEVFRSLTPQQMQRAFVHPEHGVTMTLGYQIQHYAWHCRHHVAHITALRQREGW